MSGASGQGGLKKMLGTSGMKSGLIVRQPQTLAAKVPLDGLVVGLFKQQLPVFRAVELTSVSTSFAQTAFLKSTLKVELWNGTGNLVWVVMKDERKFISQEYKERKKALPVDVLGSLLTIITDIRTIKTLKTTVNNDRLLKTLLEMEKLTPSGLTLWEVKSRKELLVALIDRFAQKVQRLSFNFGLDTDMDWQQLAQCLVPFSHLQRLDLRHVAAFDFDQALLTSDWLQNAIMNHSHLKRLVIPSHLFLSDDDAAILPILARVKDIHIYCFHPDGVDSLIDHADTDLCGLGQCQLTQLVLTMPEDGRLQVVFYDHGVYVNRYGDLLRLGYYLLSLHKFGKRVVVKMRDFPVGRMAEFITDLCRFYPAPLTEMKLGTVGGNYGYRVRIGRVTYYL